ncbi:unnamed protein product [Tilletia controversa]|uniref:Uncharacterized protein n=1 Tax=Tilletia caries TaxID=13290 RepID=A0A8T8SFT7_9BASI|nr:hypothetical protein CF336_g7873 [Tilletia laevis]KAE8186470.1 hypothetical protein CF335_g7438 [Tilletia laevis]KAE8239205.1 hypothetical protein A4X03_0g8666 [Tilletia caries]CAD6899776.1 unnamed protein product [Tilletia caries]CAD6981008.1 unnamed protein product [Tilletia controversa]
MTEAVSPLKPGLLTKLDKDRRLLELAGYSFFYDLPDGPYLNHLDELGLTPYRKDREHNFKLALESVKKTALSTQDSALKTITYGKNDRKLSRRRASSSGLSSNRMRS